MKEVEGSQASPHPFAYAMLMRRHRKKRREIFSLTSMSKLVRRDLWEQMTVAIRSLSVKK